jgi:hypothetical protein
MMILYSRGDSTAALLRLFPSNGEKARSSTFKPLSFLKGLPFSLCSCLEAFCLEAFFRSGESWGKPFFLKGLRGGEAALPPLEELFLACDALLHMFI